MNRQDRRRMAALAAMKPLPPARQDGRPLYYDIGGVDYVLCYHCIANGLINVRYHHGKAFMADPANAPDGSKDIHTICLHHLPDNAVIYDAATNVCRDKSGDNTWQEDTPSDKSLGKS